jgi:predicted RNA-binding Zn-ribbon protein involved in translation (DUF1610 family)
LRASRHGSDFDQLHREVERYHASSYAAVDSPHPGVQQEKGELHRSSGPSLRVLQFRKAAQHLEMHSGDGRWCSKDFLECWRFGGGNGMTSETKHYIEFSDLVGIEIACQQCQTTVTHTLEKFSNAAYSCPNCNRQIITQDQTDANTLHNFIRWLQAAKTLKAGGRIRLRVLSEL